MKNNVLAVNLAGIKMKNPVMVASGTFGYGEEFAKIFDLNKLGAIVTKGTTLLPRKGNPVPRIVETASGIINSIGLQNVGVDELIRSKLPFLEKFDVPVIVNISGFTISEYVKIAQKLNDTSISGLELNISCPNVEYSSKISFSHDEKLTFNVVKAVRKVTKLPLLVKLSPDVTDITKIAKSAKEGGADCLSLINTFPAMAINSATRKPVLGNVCGGLSGPAIKPIALNIIWKVFQNVKIPIVGMGGIMNTNDALEFIIAGASAIAVGTANFINPKAALEIIDGIKLYIERHKIKTVKNLVGTLKTR